ncbi:RNA polymerase sigma-70 factor [Sunxiuqinia sp. A32]|uniref:RNA polymerase sigma-70 factor n=1 Tax=Sunxiuqinia sp. A32 TaxID=3461496 RepID=UPI0040457B53
MSEQIDWTKIRNGDKSVFDKMFDFYYHPLCAFVSSYINNSQIVEDIVIDCFAKIWEERATLNIKTSLRNFLVTVVKNAAISFLRKNQLQFSNLEKVSESVIDDVANPLEDSGILNKLYESINKLPEQRRLILKMAAFEGKSYQQIADELNVSVNTVKTQMSRSYKFLKEQLNVSQRTINFLLFA